jgi:hypothetical protein
MQDEGEDEGEIQILSGLAPVYAAMFGATVAGQLLGIGIDALLGLGSIGVPLGCSVAFEAVVGARMGAARSGGALTPAQARRICMKYSAGLLGILVPTLVWIETVHTVNGSARVWTLPRLLLALGLFASATLARWALMVVLSRRRR